MEVTDGNLSWAATLDISGISKAKDTLVKYFEDMGYSAEEAGKIADEAMETIEKTVSEAMQSVKSDAEALDVLKAAFEEMKEQLSNMDDGEAKEVLQGVVDGFESVINEMEEAIEKNGELGESFNDASDMLVKLLGGQENYNKIVSQLPEPLKAAITGIKGMTGAAKAFIATPFGATIAAIVLALQAMRTWLNSSVEGQLKLAEITGYLQGILGQLKEIVIAVGKWLFKAFNDPKKAIKEFWEALKNNVVNRIKGVGDMAAALGKILKSAFTLDFEGVKAGVKELGESFLQFSTGIDNLPDKVRNKIGEIGDAAKEQAAINRARKELEIEESKFNITRAELERKMNEARAKIIDNKASKAEQQQALEDFKKYNEEILKAEEWFIDQKIALQEREMALTTNGIEEENALRDLQAQKIQKQAEAAQRMLMLNRMNNRVDAGVRVDTKTQLAAEKKIADELEKLRESNEEKRVALIRDGYAKQIAAAKLAYESELKEIERVEKAWKEANDQKLTAEQKKELEESRNLATEQWQQANADALNEMLKDYQTYEQRILDMEQEYANVIGYIRAEAYKTDEQGNFIHNEEEILGYEKAIAEAVRKQAKERLSLDLENADSTYTNVEERIEAINEAYDTYIESIRQAGASEAEINAAVEEQLELTGRLARLEAQRADLEARIRNLQQGGIDKEGLSLEELLELLAKVNKEFAKATETKSFKQVWDANKNTLVSKSLDLVTDSLYRLADASGSLNAHEAADFMSALSDGVDGLMAGGPWGLLAAGIIETLKNIADAFISAEALESSISSGRVEKWRKDMEAMMGQGKGGIFGEDTLANVNGFVSVIDEAGKKLEEFGRKGQVFEDDFNRVLGATNLLNWQNWAMAFTETSNAANTYFDALDKGYSKIEAHALRTNDRGWLLNFFGIYDQYDNLKDMVEGLGYELYDQYGNLNAEALQAILNTYTDLSEEDKKWIEKAIAYSEEYEEAMQGVADYLNSLFGQVADTIADQFIDSFLESGHAAMDFGSVVSDVARNMVKDLIKSMILQEVMNKYSEQFKAIITGDEYQDDNARTAAMLQLFMQMGAEIEELQPYIQSLLEAYQTYIGDLDGATAAISGNQLQSASQDSVDLLNGQLNAIRTNQAMMASRFDSALLQLSGIYDEVRDFHGDSNIKLDQLIDNTSEGGSILRQLGIWIG